MTNQNDNALAGGVVANGVEYAFTYHAGIRIRQRIYEKVWIVDVLENWVARKFAKLHNSMNYYGFISGRSRLFMVCVSINRPVITTAYFNTVATVHYLRKEYDYFDEVRGNAHG